LSRIRDLFFDEFYDELERVAVGIEKEETPEAPPLLADEVKRRWHGFHSDPEGREGALVSVDGGVQFSSFAYGDFVSVGRACALTHWPGHEQPIAKDVKIYVGEVFDNRDRGIIPGYVRMITEYDAAYAAASKVLKEGGMPVVLMDGSLYFGRFPYAIREYIHHGELLTELFESITRLRCLSRDHGFPLVGVTKDSTVFYMYMAMMRRAVGDAGLGWLVPEVEEASSPFNLRMKAEQWPPDKKSQAEAFLERRPLCDTALVNEVMGEEGYTHPLILAPSIYYGRDRDTPGLFDRVRKNVGVKAEPMVRALNGFFKCPGVAVTYWKPNKKARPFRVDVSASWLGYSDPWDKWKSNMFVEQGTDLKPLEMVLNHLGYWHVNPIEYNVPLKQADMLARFDRELYRQKYEPFIVKRLERAGLLVTDSRRDIREIDG
jgi:hypothetical protein